MIEIKITDPQSCDPAGLRSIATMLLGLAGHPRPQSVTDTLAPVSTAQPVGTIAPEDDPAVGAPSVHDAAAVFGGAPETVAASDPASVFGGGRVNTYPEPSTVFGGAALPNDAPSTAGVSPPSIAPAGPPGTSTAPTAPLPPAPPSAPEAPTVAVQSGALVDLDKDGLPWDERIHSGGRSKIANGTWKRKRGLSDGQIATVEAELRKVMNLPGAPTVAVPVPPPPPAAVPAPPVAAAPVNFASVKTFAEFVGEVTKAIAAQRLTMPQVTEACKAVGLPGLPLLASAPQLVTTVAANLHGLVS